MPDRVLILGAGPLADKLIEEIEARPQLHYRVLGLVDDSPHQATVSGRHRVVGRLEELESVLLAERPDRVIVALRTRRGRLPMGPLLEARMRGMAVEDGVEAYERLTGKIAIEALTPSSVVFSSHFRKSAADLRQARAVSVGLAVIGLALLSPLVALIALAIVLDSSGPVFFIHERVGAFGKPFGLLKFRTMHPTTAPVSEWERDNGHRITRVGRLLRRFRLDEIPQFLNVLRGDMNLVGPRPHPVSNYNLFLERIPYYPLRWAILPGITGWAQVRYAYANDLEEETEKMRYDLYYIKHLSSWLDLRILFETVRVVLFSRSPGPVAPKLAPAPAQGTGRLKVAASHT
jgi:exopolysaccharide biosynthesis polyprenyl glycosylphosphotransferase